MVTASKAVARATLTKISAPPAPPPPVGLRIPIEMLSPVEHKLTDFIVGNAAHAVTMCRPTTVSNGKHLAICAAGPSLNDVTIDADEVWACNSAAPHLLSRGVRVDVAIGIDQTPGLLKEWVSAPDVTYYIASSVDPELVQHLSAHGRRMQFFHNLVGVLDEMRLYKQLYPMPAIMVTTGSTIVTRVVNLAVRMGFERITIYGADCCLNGDQAHANGDSISDAYGAPLLMHGEHDGRKWVTRPDMLLTAKELVQWVRTSHGRLTLVGCALPEALLDKDEAWLDQLIKRLTPEEFAALAASPPSDSN